MTLRSIGEVFHLTRGQDSAQCFCLVTLQKNFMNSWHLVLGIYLYNEEASLLYNVLRWECVFLKKNPVILWEFGHG